MTDWLVVLPEDNWEISAREGLLGLGRDAERRLGRLADGDRVWVYVNRKYTDRHFPRVEELRGVLRVDGPVRRLQRSPWKSRGDQEFLIVRPVSVERQLAIRAKEVLKTLSFAGQPPVWGMRLLQAPLPLVPADVAALEKLLRSETR